jgi:hypothetical protein
VPSFSVGYSNTIPFLCLTSRHLLASIKLSLSVLESDFHSRITFATLHHFAKGHFAVAIRDLASIAQPHFLQILLKVSSGQL